MGGLVYGADQQLRDGERVLAGYEPGGDGTWGCLATGARQYEIHRRRRIGWNFILIERPAGKTACEFVPFRVLRGGQLRGEWQTVTLRHSHLRTRRWTFASEGWRIDARVRDTRRRITHETPPESGSAVRVDLGRSQGLEVDLEAQGPLVLTNEAQLLLAFGCWVIVEWSTGIPGNGGGGG